MIQDCEIINQPNSGEFEERIYDNQSPWNSAIWTYVKFVSLDFSEWCGVFRGQGRKIANSKLRNEILVLTSDYLWRLNRTNGELIEIEDQPQYQNLTVAPNGDFILADYYKIIRIKESIKNPINISSPIQMDMIKFKGWNGNKLNINCDEFMNWENHIELELNAENWKIEIKNDTQQAI